VHRVTWDAAREVFGFVNAPFTLFGADFPFGFDYRLPSHVAVPQPLKNKFSKFGLVRFRSPLLTESLSFSFPGVTEMFHFTPYGTDRL
jgi:hypothetical protein